MVLLQPPTRSFYSPNAVSTMRALPRWTGQAHRLQGLWSLAISLQSALGVVPGLKWKPFYFAGPYTIVSGPRRGSTPIASVRQASTQAPNIISSTQKTSKYLTSDIIILWSMCLSRFMFQTISGLRLLEAAPTFLVFPEAASTNTHLPWETPSTLLPFLQRWLGHRFLKHWIHNGEVPGDSFFSFQQQILFRSLDLCWSHQCTSKARNPSLPPCWLLPLSWIRNSFSVQLALFQPYALERQAWLPVFCDAQASGCTQWLAPCIQTWPERSLGCCWRSTILSCCTCWRPQSLCTQRYHHHVPRHYRQTYYRKPDDVPDLVADFRTQE